MSVQKASGGRKNRKWSRNKIWCQAYRISRTREKNKVRRLTKHLVRFPNDGCACNAIDNARRIIKGLA